MAEYKHANPETIKKEVDDFRNWLRVNGKSTSYASYLSNLADYTKDLGYNEDNVIGGVTSVIVGRARNQNGQKKTDLKDAAGLALVISELVKKQAKRDGNESLESVASGLKCYAMDFLLSGKMNGHEDELRQRYDVLKLSPLASKLYDQKKLRTILTSRMKTQDRKTQKKEGVYLSLKKINKFLCDQKNDKYDKFIDHLVRRIVFYVYDPFKDPVYKNRLKLKINDIDKLHFDISGQVLILTCDGNVYILLTPDFPGKGFIPAKAYIMEDLNIDHERSIADELRTLKSEIPMIDRISDAEKAKSKNPFNNVDADQLVEELKKLHRCITLRIMQADLNKAKSDKEI